MNDDARFERLFADGLHELAPRRAPDRVRTTIRAQTGETRPRARWLALIKEPTMRTNNRLAVGSPTVRVAAIMAATLLAAMMIIGAGIAGAQLFAASGPIIVDASGDGHHTTIQAAVDAAEDGDEILVRPGTYAEEITIEKDVTVRGDGPVEEVIVELADVWLFTLRETDAQITNLTLRGDGDTQGMAVVGGAPLISGLVFDGTGAPYAGTTLGDRGSLMISGGSATVADNRFLNGGEVMVGLDANAVIESNEFIDGPHLYLQDPGDDAIVRGNTFSGSFDRAMGLFGASTMTIEGNTVDGAGGDGITIGWYASPGHDPLIRDNDISGTKVGIMAFAETDPIVESNRFRDNATAIYNQSDTGTYTGNELAGNDLGIYTRGAPVLEGNSIVDGGVGIRLFGTDTSKLVMKGNTVCDNERNISTPELGDVPPLEYDESNEICEDPPTE